MTGLMLHKNGNSAWRIGRRILAVAMLLMTIGFFNVAYAQTGNVSPQTAKEGIAEAERYYKEQKYKDAVAAYDKVANEYGVSAELLYDMGNACYKDNQWAKAALCYERALKLAPGNEQIQNNLQYLYTRIDDQNSAEIKGKNMSVTPDSPSFFASLYAAIAINKSSDFWAILAAIGFVLTIGAVALYIFTRRVGARKFGFFGAFLFGVCTLLFLIFAFAASREYYSKERGIVTAYKTELLTEPKPGSKPSTTPIHAGTRLQLLDTEEDSKGAPVWYKVRLNSDFVGWLPAGEFEII